MSAMAELLNLKTAMELLNLAAQAVSAEGSVDEKRTEAVLFTRLVLEAQDPVRLSAVTLALLGLVVSVTDREQVQEWFDYQGEAIAKGHTS